MYLFYYFVFQFFFVFYRHSRPIGTPQSWIRIRDSRSRGKDTDHIDQHTVPPIICYLLFNRDANSIRNLLCKSFKVPFHKESIFVPSPTSLPQHTYIHVKKLKFLWVVKQCQTSLPYLDRRYSIVLQKYIVQ